MFVTFNKTPSAFEQALEAHRNGRLAEAERLYREVLRSNPGQLDSQHMLGLLAHQQGRSAEAVVILEKLAATNPGVAAIFSNLAEVKRSMGQLNEALALCQRALAVDAMLPAAQQNMATVLNQLGRSHEALTAALRAVELAPREAAGYTAAGCALMETNRLAEAARYLEEAARLTPNDPTVASALGCAYERLEIYDRARPQHERAVSLAPRDVRILMNMVTLLLRMEKFSEARDYLLRVLEIDPRLRVAREQLAGVLLGMREFENSIAKCRELLAERPEGVEVYATLGEALMGLGRFDECIREMDFALKIRPFPSTHQTKSNALVRNGFPAEGLAELEKGMALAPQDPILHFNKSIILMLMGRYTEAWPEYESRWQHPRMVGRNRAFNRPRWQGEALNGKRILLHAEQGMGDTIFFGRYIPLVAKRGGKVVVFCQDAMLDLVRRIEGVVEVVGENKPLPNFDAHVPIMSLPGVFGTTLENIPAAVPYITADPAKVAHWKAELARRTSKLKVGLVWEGGAFQPENFLRSNSLAAYAPLADVEGVSFFGMQKGTAEVQAKHPPAGMDFTNLAPFLNDFSDTAAILDNLDLLISIDTSVVHVAGALGKPVWMMLAYSPGHMWMLRRLDTPWYPTFKVYRQPAFKDWATPMGQVKGDLEKWVRERRGI